MVTFKELIIQIIKLYFLVNARSVSSSETGYMKEALSYF